MDCPRLTRPPLPGARDNEVDQSFFINPVKWIKEVSEVPSKRVCRNESLPWGILQIWTRLSGNSKSVPLKQTNNKHV